MKWEFAELAAATWKARQQAELDIAVGYGAAAQVPQAQIKADADVMVAKYGVDEELNARAAEAAAMAEESKIAIEQN